MFKIRQQN